MPEMKNRRELLLYAGALAITACTKPNTPPAPTLRPTTTPIETPSPIISKAFPEIIGKKSIEIGSFNVGHQRLDYYNYTTNWHINPTAMAQVLDIINSNLDSKQPIPIPFKGKTETIFLGRMEPSTHTVIISSPDRTPKWFTNPQDRGSLSRYFEVGPNPNHVTVLLPDKPGTINNQPADTTAANFELNTNLCNAAAEISSTNSDPQFLSSALVYATQSIAAVLTFRQLSDYSRYVSYISNAKHTLPDGAVINYPVLVSQAQFNTLPKPAPTLTKT